MSESLTSSMAKEKARSPPARRLAAMSGRVILRSVLKGGQPRLWAASSRVTLVC